MTSKSRSTIMSSEGAVIDIKQEFPGEEDIIILVLDETKHQDDNNKNVTPNILFDLLNVNKHSEKNQHPHSKSDENKNSNTDDRIQNMDKTTNEYEMINIDCSDIIYEVNNEIKKEEECIEDQYNSIIDLCEDEEPSQTYTVGNIGMQLPNDVSRKNKLLVYKRSKKGVVMNKKKLSKNNIKNMIALFNSKGGKNNKTTASISSNTHTCEKSECYACDNKIVSNMNIYKHTQKKYIDKSLIYPCDKCKKHFISAKRLATHIAKLHSGLDLLAHIITHANDKFKCNECGKHFDKESLLLHHRRQTHINKTFVCNVCNKEFNKRSYFILHIRVHTGFKPYNCSKCRKKFSTKTSLNVHFVRIHTKIKKFQCKECPKKFSCSSGLGTHRLSHLNESLFKCDVCNKGFMRKYNLRNHCVKEHGKTKAFQCKECPKNYFTSSGLETHMVSHNKKPIILYKCDLCDKSFMGRNGFTIHFARIHTGIKCFLCKVCPRKFYSSSHLKTHMDSHSNKLRYKCGLCNKGFSRKNNLQIHFVKVHNKKKSFLCNNCPKKFFTNVDLATHMVSHFT